MATFGTRLMVSYKALALGAGPFEIGFLASSFAAIAAAGAIPLGRVIDRVGPQPVMATGAVICAASCALVIAADSVVAIALTQSTLGLGQLMAVVGSHTILATRGPNLGRAGRIGYYTSAASLGIATGPIVAGQFISDGFAPAAANAWFLTAAVLAAIAVVAVLAIPSLRPDGGAADAAGDARLTVLGTLRRPGMVAAVGAGIAALAANELLVAYLPLYGEAVAINPEIIGVTVGALSLSQIISRVGLGRLIARFGASRALVASMLIAGVATPVMIVDSEPALMIVTAVVIGVAIGIAQPLSLVWVVHAIPRHSQGLAMGVRMTGNRFGQFAIPVTVGATAGRFGTVAVFLTIAAMLVAAAGLVSSRRASLDATERD